MGNLQYDFIVVGAGFSGSVVARELADSGYKVLVIDSRSHIGGNAYDSYDTNGILIHHYGPHIFHTGSDVVYKWLSRFTKWREYEHKVLSSINGRLVSFPINKKTIKSLYDLDLTTDEMHAFIAAKKVAIADIKTSQDLVLASVGQELSDIFYKNYTLKQWGISLADLSPGVAARIPVRFNNDDRYFTDKFQVMPLQGYTFMFENILDHPYIKVMTSVGYADISQHVVCGHTIFTGPIDMYFDYCFGRLKYRSLRFEHEHIENLDQYQITGTINYPNDYSYTRITEFKHITGQVCAGTSIVREYPTSKGDPYYPIPQQENTDLYLKYKVLASQQKEVTFIGRLAEYKYYNMDQVVSSALLHARRFIT
jgi:UDP-galactopyranose mutase